MRMFAHTIALVSFMLSVALHASGFICKFQEEKTHTLTHKQTTTSNKKKHVKKKGQIFGACSSMGFV